IEYTGKHEHFGGSGLTTPPYATTDYGYDAADALLNVYDAACPRDANGNLLWGTGTDANGNLLPQGGNTTTLVYDRFGRKTRQVDPDMGSWLYEYDPLGNLTRQT